MQEQKGYYEGSSYRGCPGRRGKTLRARKAALRQREGKGDPELAEKSRNTNYHSQGARWGVSIEQRGETALERLDAVQEQPPTRG